MLTDELTCEELVEIVTDYLEGSMPPKERWQFDDHLAGCPGCVAYVEQFRETIRLTGLSAEDLTPQAREDLLEAFRSWKKRIREAGPRGA